MNHATITLNNGLGDKLLDLVGFVVLCNYLNYQPYVKFKNDGKFVWGHTHYDMRLFQFNGITLSEEHCDFYVTSYNPSSSLCPYEVYDFLKPFFPSLSFEKISHDFVLCSKQVIHPSELILSKIPKNIESAYGIHLRKSDKVADHVDLRHENTWSEFDIIIHQLLEDVTFIIMNEPEATFFVVSEDVSWKQEISHRIMYISKQHHKQIHFITLDYTTGQ